MNGRERSSLIKKMNSTGGLASDNKAGMVEMLRSSGSLEYAYSRAQEFVEKAIALLAGLRESDAKEALIETARFIGRRGV